MTKTYITERNIEGEKFIFYHLGNPDDIHVEGEENSLGYPNHISIYPPDIFGHENYGTTRHVAFWKLKELRKTYNRLLKQRHEKGEKK